MMKDYLKNDELCLLTGRISNSPRPYSNVSEYCLRDGEAVRKYLAVKGGDTDIEHMSDYELLAAVRERLKTDGSSFVAVSLKGAMDDLLGCDTAGLSNEELWSRAHLILDEKKADGLFSFELDSIGVPLIPWADCGEMPMSVGKTIVRAKYCPLGTEFFDLENALDLPRDGWEFSAECDATAVFCKGFSFEVPNEYAAGKAEERLRSGRAISANERAILSAQTMRRIALNSANGNRELMLFLPSAPDVCAMGELDRFLDYIDSQIRGGRLDITVYAPDAVGLCFAAGLASKRFEKITAATGVCGNGCGCASAEAAAYWGVELEGLKRASLSSTPAFIGK